MIHCRVGSWLYLKKDYTRLESPDRDKHSSLLRKFVNYGQKSVIIFGAGLNNDQRYHKVKIDLELSIFLQFLDFDFLWFETGFFFYKLVIGSVCYRRYFLSDGPIR